MYSANPTLGYYVPPLDVNNLTDQQTAISIEHLSLYYQQSRALSDISMRIPKGQVTAFIGPSGCGKSTLLRCINRIIAWQKHLSSGCGCANAAPPSRDGVSAPESLS